MKRIILFFAFVILASFFASAQNIDSSSEYVKSLTVIFDGSISEMQELEDTEGFNAWIKGQDPSYVRDMTLISWEY